MWVSLVVDAADQEKFTALPQARRRAIITELKIEMARLGVQWGGIGDPLKEVNYPPASWGASGTIKHF